MAAAPAPQNKPPVQIMLGELWTQTVAPDQPLLLLFDAPIEGEYQLQDAGSAPSDAVTLAVRNAAGEAFYDGSLDAAGLRLAAGSYQLTVSAAQEVQLALLIMGQIGELSADPTVPGLLFAGGIVQAQDVEGALAGSLIIPETPYAQEVTLNIVPAQGESYLASIQGADVSTVMSTDEANQLRFVSRGGFYQVIVQPDSPATSFTLSTQVSGPPPLLPIGAPVTSALPAGASSVAWRFEPTRFYPTLSIQLSEADAATPINLEVHVEDEQGVTLYKQRYVAEGDPQGSNLLEQITPGRYFLTLNRLDEAAAELPFELALIGAPAPESIPIASGVEIPGDIAVTEAEAPIRLYNFNVEQSGALITVSRTDSAENDYILNVGRKEGESLWRTALPPGAPTVQFVAPDAGPYYVTLLGAQGVFSYTLQVLESAPVPQINVNGLTWGDVAAGDVAFFRLPLVEAQRWVTLLLAGSNRTELDISINGYDETGKPVEVRLSSTPQSSTEVISLITDGPRAYEVRVENHGERAAGFFLLARVENPAAISQQWAIAAAVDGQPTEAAQLAVGEPDAIADAIAAAEPITETDALTGATILPGALTITGVWSPAADDEVAALELTYSRAVVPSQVEIYISSPPAQIGSIEAFDAENDTWIVLWAGEDAAETAPGIFSPQLAAVDFAADRIRIVVDTLLSEMTATVDAVKLIGRP
ncbi:MAG: hypothetical protein R3A44_20350 [Caldilineaceae bacterium]